MAAAEVASRRPDRPSKRRPFAAWVKRLTSLKGGEQNGGNAKKSGTVSAGAKQKLGNGALKNNPYPESGFARRQSPRSSRDDHSFATPASHPQNDDGSIISGHVQERDGRSAAPTLATNAETVHSDAGHSKAFTSTTGGGAFSSLHGAGNNSTFSSPNQSQQSLTTTLTTIQSTSPGNTLQNGSSGPTSHNQGGPVMFSHQYPVSPAPSNLNAVSAIPRHLTSDRPTDSNSTLLTDDASILTLASSSKRRRRSMDTDASVRALAPNSVWGGSRESLPLSVLSGTADGAASITGLYSASQSRPSFGGIASTERASVYSSQGVAAPALASERNSYYAAASARKDLGDAKSLRSINNLDARSQYDTRSMTDARSLHNTGDARSLHDARSTHDTRSMNMDVGSLRNYDGSIRSGALGHGRNDSIPGSIGSPLASPGLRHASTSGALSRRSSDWNRERIEDDEEEAEEEGTLEGRVKRREETEVEGKL